MPREYEVGLRRRSSYGNQRIRSRSPVWETPRREASAERRSHRWEAERRSHRRESPQGRRGHQRQVSGGGRQRENSDKRRERTSLSNSHGKSEVTELSEAIIKGISRIVQELEVRSNNQLVSVTSITSSIVPDFNPLYQNVKEWLEMVDEFKYLYKWDDKTVCHLALNKLRGPAETWYRGLPHVFLIGPNENKCFLITLNLSEICIIC